MMFDFSLVGACSVTAMTGTLGRSGEDAAEGFGVSGAWVLGYTMLYMYLYSP